MTPTRMDLMSARSMLIGRRRDLKRTGTQIGLREYNAAIWAIEEKLKGDSIDLPNSNYGKGLAGY